jgi:pimeloyl-ACP methyl ester carboxylesterase
VARLATRSWGEGRPLAVLVHGITSSSRTWWRTGPALAERGFRVLAVDLRGHGASPPLVAGLGAAELAADVAETVEAAARPAAVPAPAGGAGETSTASTPAGAADERQDHPPEPRIDLLVGHSLGALVALELLAARPGIARRLVLEDPPGPTSIDWAGLAAGIRADGSRARAEPAALRRDLEAANPGWAPGEAERRVADLADLDASAVAAALRPGAAFDLAARLAAAGVPTLLLLSEEALGSVLVGDDRKAAVEALGDGATRVLPAGHSVHREALDAWLRELDAWLAR